MSTILITGMWHCQGCGQSGVLEPVDMDSEDRQVSIHIDHECTNGWEAW